VLDDVIGGLHAELAEAEYIGERGVGVGASIGAVRCRGDEMSAAELFRAADTALRTAKSTGRRQWAGFHPRDDGTARRRHAYAAELPAAWENGRLRIAYEPVVRIADGHAVAAHPVLVWERDDGERLDHLEVLAHAERSGMSVQLGPSMLADVCARLPELDAALAGEPGALLRLQLTRLQSGDGDLVRSVQRALEAAGARPERLEIGLDTGAVLDDYGDARDNLEVLTAIDVSTGLCGFQGGPRELDLVADTAVRTVTLGVAGAGTAGRENAGAVLRAETERLVRTIVAGGRECAVIDVRSEAEARWWAAAGVTTVQGGVFGGPVAASHLSALPDLTRPVTTG